MVEFQVGDKVRIYGELVQGSTRTDVTVNDKTEEGPVRAINGYLYHMKESGRGWAASRPRAAVKSYFMPSQPFLMAEVISTQWGPAFAIDSDHLDDRYANWARKPYVRKNGKANPNLTIRNYSSPELKMDGWRKIDMFPMYGLNCNKEFGIEFSKKNKIELVDS